MLGSSSIVRADPAFLVRLADWLAVAVAVALPWSTTAVGIAIAAWLFVLLPTLNAAAVKRELATAAGGLPVLLWCLGLLGMLWADVSWHDRLAALGSFHRLLVIPLLFAQFRQSANGIWVLRGFFIATTAVLIASYLIVLVFGHSWHGIYGVPVHDTIFQGSVFLICGFGALGYSVLTGVKHHWGWRTAICTIGVLFLINFAVATPSRSALIIMPLFLILLGWRLARWKGILIAILLSVLLGVAAWFASPEL